MSKVHVKRGDLVEILGGNDRGKRGKILEVEPGKNRVIVDGIRVQKRHTRPSQQNQRGGVIDRPGPVHSSNVAKVCPHCDKATRIGRERNEDGDLALRCKRCGKVMD